MMPRIFQDTRQKRTDGAKAPWYVEWRQNGRRVSVRVGTKAKAVKYAHRKEVELDDGKLGLPAKKRWADFRSEYESLILPSQSPRSQAESRHSLDTFEELVHPVLVRSIDRKMLDAFISKRRTMRGKKQESSISTETIKKDVRTIRAALRVAVEWRYLPEVPGHQKLKGLVQEKRFLRAEHFTALVETLANGNTPRLPKADGRVWWNALLYAIWVTGIRIGSALKLKWEDVHFDDGIAVSQPQDNKAGRVTRHRIHKAVPALKELRAVQSVHSALVFPWEHDRTTLDNAFMRLQHAAGIHLPCPGEHSHTPKCHVYGFHDIRRAHATYNYGRVSDAELQEQMAHRSFQTTQSYIKYAELQQEKAYDAYLPDAIPV